MTGKLIALACLNFVRAHASRNPECQWFTANEREALAALEYRLAARRREDSSPLSETAA